MFKGVSCLIFEEDAHYKEQSYDNKSEKQLLEYLFQQLKSRSYDNFFGISSSLNDTLADEEKELFEDKFVSKLQEISSNTADLNAKLDVLLRISKELIFILEEILGTLSSNYITSRVKEENLAVHIRDHVGEKTKSELPKFDSIEEKLRYVNNKIKEIGPISKRGAIEE